jgi:putative ABC transport system permease protein
LSREANAVTGVLAQTANPEHPDEVQVSRPADALIVRAAAKSAFSGLFLRLGAVPPRTTCASSSGLGDPLSTIGAVAGAAVGALATAVYVSFKSWAVVIRPIAWGGGVGRRRHDRRGRRPAPGAAHRLVSPQPFGEFEEPQIHR